MGPKAHVGIYTASKKSVVVLILAQGDTETTIAMGQGMKGRAVRTVPSATVRRFPSSLSFDVSSAVVNRHCEDTSLIHHSADQEDDAAEEGPPEHSPTVQLSNVSLLQSMLVAPFDSITQWAQPAATVAFVAIAALIFLLKNARWLWPGLPSLIYRFVNDGSTLEPLLLVIAAALSIASAHHTMDAAYRSRLLPISSSTTAWRIAAVIPLIIVTAVGTIHRDWSPHAQRTSLLGRAVSQVYPWLDVSVDETCLYTVAAVAVLRRATRSVTAP